MFVGLTISSAKIRGSQEPQNFLLFDDASQVILSRTFRPAKPIVYDKQKFATASDLSEYIRNQHNIDWITAEWQAQEARFANPAAKAALLATGSKYLQYNVTNPNLGIGSDGKGKNIYGTILIALREKIKNEEAYVRQLKKSKKLVARL